MADLFESIVPVPGDWVAEIQRQGVYQPEILPVVCFGLENGFVVPIVFSFKNQRLVSVHDLVNEDWREGTRDGTPWRHNEGDQLRVGPRKDRY